MSAKACTTSSPLPPLSPGTMRIYSMRFCPYAERTLLVLEHKNIKYETVNIDLKQKPSWFWDRNPNGTVPIIEQDGKVLYESLVTCDYLDEMYPENRLTPTDPYRKAQDRLVVDLFSKVITCFYKFYRGGTDEDVKNFSEALDKVEKVYAERGTPFFGGESVQMVDLMMWPHTERMEAVSQIVPQCQVSADRYPKFLAWIKNMEGVDAVKKCRWDTATHVHFIKSAKNGKPDYDYGLQNFKTTGKKVPLIAMKTVLIS